MLDAEVIGRPSHAAKLTKRGSGVLMRPTEATQQIHTLKHRREICHRFSETSSPFVHMDRDVSDDDRRVLCAEALDLHRKGNVVNNPVHGIQAD